MASIQNHLPTDNQALFTAIGAIAANAALFGFASKVSQLPTASINSALTSTVASSLAALLGHSVASATKGYVADEGTTKETAYKAGVIALFVVLANVATTADALKSRASFLDMDVKSALSHSAFSALGIVGLNYFMTPKPDYNGKFADEHGALLDALTEAQDALKAKGGKDNADELAEFNKAKAAYNTFAGKYNFTVKEDREAIEAFKKTEAYTNVPAK